MQGYALNVRKLITQLNLQYYQNVLKVQQECEVSYKRTAVSVYIKYSLI